jgi:hypothetical protein
MTVEKLQRANALANAISAIGRSKDKNGNFKGLEINHRCGDNSSGGVEEIRFALSKIDADYANEYLQALEVIKQQYTKLTDQWLENLKQEFGRL